MCKCICNTFGNISRILILLACALALTLQVFTTMSCKMVNVNMNGADAGSLGIFFAVTNPGSDQCQEEQYPTDDALIKGARSALILSMIAGFIAGLMVAFEWLCCRICCAGVLDGMGFLLAWVSGAVAFMFNGNKFCTENGVSCELTQEASMLIVAIICYFACGVLLCFSPQPDPICQGSSKE